MITNKNTKPRILIISYNGLGCSGVPNVIYNIFSNLSDDFLFDVICFNDDNYFYDKLDYRKKKNVKIIKFDEGCPKNTFFGKIKYRFFDKKKIINNQIVKLLSENTYTAIHSFKEVFSWFYFKQAKKNNIRIRILHNNIDYLRKKSLFGHFYFWLNKKKSIKYATELVSVSKQSGKNAFGRKKHVIIYNPINENIFNDKIDLPDSYLNFFQLGTYNSNKNQLFSVEILHFLRMFNDYKLFLIGYENEPGFKRRITDLITLYSLNSAVQFVDGKNDYTSVIKKCFFSILPSKNEGASLASVESQACNRHVFASASVPPDVDCGKITFLNLKDGAKKWAETINTFCLNEQVAKQQKADIKSFSLGNFKRSIAKLYSTK